MSRYLCTFPGKTGDILWALPTARVIAGRIGAPVDFACMPKYESLLSLLQAQSYIDKAFVIQDWHCTGSPYGDQPWAAPRQVGYEQQIDLGYRHHPFQGSSACLMDFIARQQGIELGEKPLPFIQYLPGETVTSMTSWVAYAFNGNYRRQKDEFLLRLKAGLSRLGRLPEFEWCDVSEYRWAVAAHLIQKAIAFVGCRSANYVLAHGVGCQIISFEPDINRNNLGPYGRVFGCPYGTEYGFSRVDEVERAAGVLYRWSAEEVNATD